ncbi:Do family serine endopeptidase [Methylobacterium oxalidis]|uniref:Protease Do n=1 Tax=Methylobacterium oxalidis TaxID=944322 RepID=A0A512JDD9_9HYPH|nr:Do family serine endopeptidase [Methylobacterium oxalidis]GEP07956.1 protease Do [Methylobacterium oxalidis]GJE35117.1 Periplasmic pH-dependent serine endoprotease DegQ [Methylobacterium oxalidis]GLS64509.1 protease Do [Methylobacterium oxalidis]
MYRVVKRQLWGVGIVSSLAIAAVAMPPGHATAQPPAAPIDFTTIVRQKMPAVVAILTKQMIELQDQDASEATTLEELLRRRFGGRRGGGIERPARTSLGSGFVISRDGYIVTNNHVIGNAAEIHVRLADKTDLPAKLIGRDPATDVAVLKIEPPAGLTVASWGDSDRMEPGAWTIAIGSPFGLGGTVTVGVLSARSRDIQAGPYDDYLQTDAAINQGNSGGPLFNAAGEVIGVNTAIFSPSGGSVGIGFAVPSRTAQAVAEQIIQTGRVERGFVGLRLQEITSAIAQALGRSGTEGALIAGVEPGGPAEKAGVMVGDIVTALNGKQVQSGRDLSRRIAALKPGTSVTLDVIRENKTHSFSIKLGHRDGGPPASQTGMSELDGSRRLGLVLAPVPDEARIQLGLTANTPGVLVQRVDPGSPAAEGGMQPGDVIVSVNNQAAREPPDVARAWSEAQKQGKPVLCGLLRGGRFIFVAIKG